MITPKATSRPGARDSGFIKSGITPGGGFNAGTREMSVPDGTVKDMVKVLVSKLKNDNLRRYLVECNA